LQTCTFTTRARRSQVGVAFADLEVRLRPVLACTLALLLPSLASAAARHPFTVEDMLAMERVGEPARSPDGRLIAYQLRTVDYEANQLRSDVWVAATDGSGTRRLTTHPEKDFQPAFSSDGRWIYFLSTRSGSGQVWRIAPTGGEAEQVTKLPVEVGGFVVVDGRRLVLTIDVYPDAASLEETAKRDQERAQKKSKAMAFDELLFRHWDQWEDGKRAHLFVWEEGKAPRDLMKGMAADAPTHPFGGMEELAISHDAKTLVFCAKDDGKTAAWTTNVDLWAVPLDGSKRPERLTAANLAWDGNPVFSPDGRTLAYLAMARPGYESDRRRVVLLDWPSRKSRVLTEAWDRSPEEIAFASDGKSLYATADQLGHRALFRVDLASGQPTAIAEVGTFKNPMALPDGSVAYLRNALSQPDEIFVRASAPGATERALTHHNDARVAAIDWGAWEQFTFKGAHGDDVHGFVMRPAGHRGQKVPVAFLIHGGPQGSFGNDFHYRWNPQAYAGHGYAVVFIDFHGSTGYGQAFTDAIRGDWGGAPFEDLMKGLDFVLAKHKFLDEKRVVALGASFGGYMINWINGHTDRFAALVCHDGNLDEEMAYYDTEELWFPEWEHGGPAWDHHDSFARQSPLHFVKNWKTPTLVVHGGQDFRVVDTHGMATFTALQRKGIPSRFLYFPEENHWVLRPQNSKRWHDEVLGWLDRWTRATR
jgi:dipeptidyl aminopeptidase/acylaminoacyl peptidase